MSWSLQASGAGKRGVLRGVATLEETIHRGAGKTPELVHD